jgi:arginine-tRNA-protein transferase
LPDSYGSFHLREPTQLVLIELMKVYKVDDELIGISVIDILPHCISSVYFIWHPDWAWASLGKLSALHEIALSVELYKAGLEELKFLYMGKSAVSNQRQAD